MEIDEGTFNEVIDVVRSLCDEVSRLKEAVSDLEERKVIGRLDEIEKEFGTFTGGLNDIIDGRRKREYTDQIRTNKPELGKYEGIGKRFGIDVFNTVADKTYDMPEEQREGAIGEMMAELSSKFDDLIAALETQNTHESAEPPKEEAAEQTPDGGKLEIEVQTGEAPDQSVIEMARKFRKRAEGDK